MFSRCSPATRHTATPQQGTLPLRPEALRKLALVGPFGDNGAHMLGTYVGAASGPIASPLAALRAALPGVEVTWDAGTARRYTEENAERDAQRCKVGAQHGSAAAAAGTWRQ